MEPKYFYRIEKDGEGPYCLSSDAWKRQGHGFLNTPSPYEDNIIDNSMDLRSAIRFIDKMENFLFCFSSIEQMIDWFMGEEIQILIEKFKYSIVKVEATKYVLGMKQAVFHKDSYKIVNKISSFKEFEERILDF